MYKAVIFDFGGVMHASTHSYTRQDVLDALKGDHSLTDDELHAIYSEGIDQLMLGKINDDTFWTNAYQKVGLPRPENYTETWKKRLHEDGHPYEDMFALVEELKQNGIKTYVLSNTIHPHAEVLRAKKLYDPFDGVFLSQEIGLRKPEEAAYRYVLEKINLDPSEVIFVDDLEENLVPARTLGITTVLAENPPQVIEEVHKLLDLN